MHIRNVITGALLGAGALAHPLAAQTGCTTVSDPARIGVQGTTLRMAPATYRISGQRFTTNVYNGSFVAPTLTMRAGERMNLSVVNAMVPNDSQSVQQVAWTNQHYHGLVVTPRPDGGDNVTNVTINRGDPPRKYDFLVPGFHTEGMFWYHPHPHGLTNSQVAGGLSGALMVGSILRYFPQYAGVKERTLLIRDMSFHIQNQLLNINGSTCALLPVAPGEKQLWHIGNFGSNNFINLKLDGMRWTLLALDGNPLARVEEVDSLFIPPGSRAEVIVTGPAAGRRVRLYSAPFLTGPDTAITMGYMVGAGRPSLRSIIQPAGLDKSVVDTIHFLSRAADVRKLTFRYTFTTDSATVNDTIYAPNHLPVNVPWGQVQEWTIVNTTQFPHTFHIHQTDFLVTTVNGRPANEGRLRDNVAIGVHQVAVRDSTGKVTQQTVGDTVTVRFVFEPIAAGPFVFHCHVLQHEDEGMMHNVCVYDPRDPDGQNKCNAYFSGNAHIH